LGADFIQSVTDLLARHSELCLGILFGSSAAARGRVRADSDLDIAVAARHPLPAAAKKALIEQLAALSGRPVDLIDLQTAGGPIVREALSKGRLLFCRDRALYAGLIKRMLFDEADFAPYRERILAERRKAWTGL